MGDDDQIQMFDNAPEGVERPDEGSMDLTCGADPELPNAGEASMEEPDA